MIRLGLLFTLGLVAASCTGVIKSDSGSGSGKGTGDSKDPSKPGTPANSDKPPGMMPPDSTTTPAAGLCQSSATVGRRVLRRLTNLELETTIRTTFGLTAVQWPGLTVPPDSGSQDGFTNNAANLTVSPDYAQGAFEGSRKVATLVSADPLLGTLLPCAATGGATCADTFVSTFGAKLYRRPVTAPEKARFMALFDKISKQSDFRTFVYWATSTMLQSPNLIYRSEIGDPDGAGRFKLSPYEVATNLAYTFTGLPPTPELTALAAANKLASADQIEAAARALVFDAQNAVKPAFRDVILRFADQWLGLGSLSNLKKDATLYPAFNGEIQDSLAEETRRFISAVVLEDKGGVGALLTAPFTFVDTKLAKYYGFGAATGTDFVRVNRPQGWGVGLLAQGSMMAVEANGLGTSPTRRGHNVRTRFLCGVVPPPPPVVSPIGDPTPTQTTRERYLAHSQNPECAACHALMDQAGFAFEHLDADGRYRAKEGMFNINDAAVVMGTSAGDLKVTGAGELATGLAKLPEVNDCLASYVAAYALGISHDTASCLVSAQTAELRSGASLIDFYVKLSRADHFRIRQP